MIIAALTAAAFAQVANPPMVVQVDEATVIVTPANTLIVIPAGSRIEACVASNGSTLSYDLAGRVVRVLKPCRDPNTVFKDGFE